MRIPKDIENTLERVQFCMIVRFPFRRENFNVIYLSCAHFLESKKKNLPSNGLFHAMAMKHFFDGIKNFNRQKGMNLHKIFPKNPNGNDKFRNIKSGNECTMRNSCAERSKKIASFRFE